jgi:hypothetical protein
MGKADRQAWAHFIDSGLHRTTPSAGASAPWEAPPTSAATSLAQRAVRAAMENRVGRLGNRATVIDGIKFHSKLEADRWRELQLLQKAGEVLYTLRQVPFDVAPGVTYRLDFLIRWANGRREACTSCAQATEPVTYEDTKGHLTDTSRTKIAVVQERYRIHIRILTRADVSR